MAENGLRENRAALAVALPARVPAVLAAVGVKSPWVLGGRRRLPGSRRIMPVLYSPLIASTAMIAITAWPR
jgi:hypothetical protein